MVDGILRFQRQATRDSTASKRLDKKNSSKLEGGMKKQPEQAENVDRQSNVEHPECVEQLGDEVNDVAASHEYKLLQIKNFPVHAKESECRRDMRSDKRRFEKKAQAARAPPNGFLRPSQIEKCKWNER